MFKLNYLTLVMYLYFGLTKSAVIPNGFQHYEPIEATVYPAPAYHSLPYLCVYTSIFETPYLLPCPIFQPESDPSIEYPISSSMVEEGTEIFHRSAITEGEHPFGNDSHVKEITTTEVAVKNKSLETKLLIFAPEEKKQDNSSFNDHEKLNFFKSGKKIGKNCLERVVENENKTYRLIACGIENSNGAVENRDQLNDNSITKSNNTQGYNYLVDVLDVDKVYDLTTPLNNVNQDYNSTITLGEEEMDDNFTTALQNSEYYPVIFPLENEDVYTSTTITSDDENQDYDYNSTTASTLISPNIMNMVITQSSTLVNNKTNYNSTDNAILDIEKPDFKIISG